MKIFFLNDINHKAYVLDSTTIDFCLQMFPWTKFRRNKGAVKMHTLLDLQGSISTFIKITSGSVHHVNILDQFPILAGAVYIDMDTSIIKRCFVFNRRVGFLSSGPRKIWHLTECIAFLCLCHY